MQGFQTILIPASAQGNRLACAEPDIIAVALRNDMADVTEIYNIAVVAAEEEAAGEFFQYGGYLSGFADDSVFAVEDQIPPVCFDETALGVIKLEMSFFCIEPEKRFRYSDINMQLRIIAAYGIFEMLNKRAPAAFGDFADNEFDFIHGNRFFLRNVLFIND